MRSLLAAFNHLNRTINAYEPFLGFAAKASASPPEFIFTVKASRYITHMKKLKQADDALEPLLERVRLLDDKLGVILFQLPPRWRLNLERLDHFLNLLPGSCRFAFEFRDPSWFAPHVYEALARSEAGFCIYDLKGRLCCFVLGAGFLDTAGNHVTECNSLD